MAKRTSEFSVLSQQIFIFISLATKLAGRDHEQRISSQLPGISGLQHGVMQILTEQDFTLGELAHMMLLAPATLVPVVDRLEKEKLLVRGTDPGDRRRNPLHLTERGREMLSGMSQFNSPDLMMCSLQAMGREKTEQLNELLKELIQQLSPGEDYVGQILSNLTGSAQEPGNRKG